ncbi:MAG: T9SS type A sorting domain-containing protein [Candidatus Latescibacteria bacterium]|nr:T9SS type A sorting domain-containing protein [Candidatus Latescibacterota bacterium]NIO29059.1 T9SS type A sorting domain-containing protein [Candidatus Latescibacterota bacterium]NIO56684.1 T9SS type A sorting domain-containing protein [Candidatus Latescibacterota bacterium]NIT02267.1 T9SS type A sorting domain-containing protein [Candidatus Latescibacterota bacterium]NIT39152.1 T9SS type A sorting domain-containing protein [Candidatus Latescibacterota bacterium]
MDWRWNAVCTDTLAQRDPQITTDGAGGAIIAWRDGRNGNDDIFAQRINSLGNVLWTSNGVAICNADESQWDPQLATDGSSGAIIAWQDSRSNYWDVYAQRIDADSVVQWASDGAEISTAAGNQDEPQITSDGDGGAIITWQDNRSDADYDTFACRINDYLVPTLLRSCFASYEEPAITITWTLSEIDVGIRFSILRKQLPQETFRKIQNPVIEQSGLFFICADRSCRPGSTYLYRVEVQYEETRRFLFETDPICVPVTFISLNQNYPNPSNPGTTMTFTLPEKAQVNLSVYNMEGKLVRTLVNESMDGGLKEITWDGRNNQGNPVGSGIYLYRLKAGNRILMKKMVHLKWSLPRC